MEWYEQEVRAMEKVIPPGTSPMPPIIFYGSSSIRLWSTLATDLGDPRILNLGFGGSTMEACAYYFERLVVPRKPSSLVLYAGDNDLGDGRSARDVFASFRELTRKLDAHLGPIPLGFISIKPSPARWPLIDEIRSANALIKDQLQSRSRSTYIDVFQPMLNATGRPRPELYLEDGLHLGAAGYRVWTEQILLHRDMIF